MAVTEFSLALNQVATERGIPVESVVDSIKTALATAYKKDRKEHGEDVEIEEIEIDLDNNTGEVRILKDGEDVTPSGFGRIAAQTAKQVILQKIRETEKDVILSEFRDKIGQIVNGQVFRISNGIITLDLGKSHAQGVMPQSEQVSTEIYRVNQRLKVLIKDVRQNLKGTEIIVSRSDPNFVKELFRQEVPEIASETVVIEAIAREPGSRTKMAVSSNDEKIDAVGSCVGQKGVRVQSIISELFGEKIDIIPYSGVAEKFIASSLSPAKVSDVELFDDEKRAVVTVPEDQQSLAIGKEGQNARLANKLTKWKIDIKGVSGLFISDTGEAEAKDTSDKKVIGVWDSEIKKFEEESSKEDVSDSDDEKDEEASGDDKAESQANEDIPEPEDSKNYNKEESDPDDSADSDEDSENKDANKTGPKDSESEEITEDSDAGKTEIQDKINQKEDENSSGDLKDEG